MTPNPISEALRVSKRRLAKAYYRHFGLRVRDNEHGFSFCGNSPSDKSVFKEIYGPADAYRLDLLVPFIRGKNVVDIGAHKGFFAVLAGSLANRVIAFEPAPENYHYLRRNIAANNLRNIEARQEAVSNEEGSKTLTLSCKTAARNSFYQTLFAGTGIPVAVQCTTLARVMAEYSFDRIGLLKMDCEGGEYDILMAIEPEIFEKIDAIALEIHEAPGIPGTKAEIISFLERQGYKGIVYDERRSEAMRLYMGIFTRNWADAYRLDLLAPFMRGKSVVDIGAHKGFFALLAGSLANRVIAFEPAPENYHYLRRNIAANNLRNIEARQEAVSNEGGSKTLIVSGKTPARHSLYQTQFGGAGTPVAVQCTTLAKVMADYGLDRIGLLKMDCEGSEHDILTATAPEIFEKIDAIALEIHEAPGIPGTKAEIISFLERQGYKGIVYDERRSEAMRLCMGIFTRN